MSKRILLTLTAWFFMALFSIGAKAVVVDPTVSTTRTAGNADDPAIWIDQESKSRSVIIGTDKDAGIYVWNFDGHELQHINQGTAVNNVDVEYGFRLGSDVVDIVVANLRDAAKLAVFKVNKNYSGGNVLTQIAGRNSNNNDIQADSYGFGLYKRKSDGSIFVFERPKNGGKIRQYLIEGDETGNGVRVTAVRDLNYSGDTAEGFVADNELGFLYVAEESEGIHKYFADPNRNGEELSFFATGDGISGDREGLALYACNDGTGYLVLSSQGNSTFKIYERQGDNRFVKTVEPRDDRGSGGLGSDGLDVTSSAVPPNFPNGFLVAHDESAARYHIYDWAQVAESDLRICVDGGDTPTVATSPLSAPENLRIISK